MNKKIILFALSGLVVMASSAQPDQNNPIPVQKDPETGAWKAFYNKMTEKRPAEQDVVCSFEVLENQVDVNLSQFGHGFMSGFSAYMGYNLLSTNYAPTPKPRAQYPVEARNNIYLENNRFLEEDLRYQFFQKNKYNFALATIPAAIVFGYKYLSGEINPIKITPIKTPAPENQATEDESTA